MNIDPKPKNQHFWGEDCKGIPIFFEILFFIITNFSSSLRQTWVIFYPKTIADNVIIIEILIHTHHQVTLVQIFENFSFCCSFSNEIRWNLLTHTQQYVKSTDIFWNISFRAYFALVLFYQEEEVISLWNILRFHQMIQLFLLETNPPIPNNFKKKNSVISSNWLFRNFKTFVYKFWDFSWKVSIKCQNI